MQRQNWRARKRHVIYRHGSIYIVPFRHMALHFDAEQKKQHVYETYIRTKWSFRQKDSSYVRMVWHIALMTCIWTAIHDIYNGFHFMSVRRINVTAFRVKLILWLRIWNAKPRDVSKLGCSYNRPDATYALPFHTLKGEWQRICVSTTTYDRVEDETNKMSALWKYVERERAQLRRHLVESPLDRRLSLYRVSIAE